MGIWRWKLVRQLGSIHVVLTPLGRAGGARGITRQTSFPQGKKSYFVQKIAGS
jgi:hypothetical protein